MTLEPEKIIWLIFDAILAATLWFIANELWAHATLDDKSSLTGLSAMVFLVFSLALIQSARVAWGFIGLAVRYHQKITSK